MPKVAARKAKNATQKGIAIGPKVTALTPKDSTPKRDGKEAKNALRNGSVVVSQSAAHKGVVVSSEGTARNGARQNVVVPEQTSDGHTEVAPAATGVRPKAGTRKAAAGKVVMKPARMAAKHRAVLKPAATGAAPSQQPARRKTV